MGEARQAKTKTKTKKRKRGAGELSAFPLF
jgi:hypothetical protein